jgi:outer membrane protein OmpA-like peptidoglycan-associated protein
VTLPTVIYPGLKFLGWSEKQVTTSGVTKSFTPTADVDLYQVWRNLPLSTGVFFPGDSPSLTSKTKKTLTSLANKVKGMSQRAQLYVDGWVKETADKSYDLRLSKDRANATARFLRLIGVNAVIQQLTPRGIFPLADPRARRAEIAVFFSGKTR